MLFEESPKTPFEDILMSDSILEALGWKFSIYPWTIRVNLAIRTPRILGAHKSGGGGFQLDTVLLTSHPVFDKIEQILRMHDFDET